MALDNKIYSACYSNVPVYEYNVGPGAHIMRRRADDWINATHILKAASYDKPARTRILEREVQKGVHEKVQGGYGKYQGTWIPLPDGRGLAERNNVLEKLLPIFDFTPGDRSPPPAPKHATAATNRPRAPRQPAAARRVANTGNAPQQSAPKAKKLRAPAVTASQATPVPEHDYDAASVGQYHEDGTPDNITVVSESMVDDDAYLQYGSSKKRKRADQMSLQDQQHQIWADQLLDYFMLLESEESMPSPPEPPPSVNLDRPIDEKGHSAMHWAAAMGDIAVVKSLIQSGARIDCLSNNLETPLMRAVMFTNNFDKQTMKQLVRILAQTVHKTDWFGSTVFHHISATTSSKNKYLSARYYMDTIINVLQETWRPDRITDLLNVQDQNGDTAVMIAAKHGARKCVRSLLGRNVSVDVPNAAGETADDLIRDLNTRRRFHNVSRSGREASSSPFAPDGRGGANGETNMMIEKLMNGVGVQIKAPQYRSATANSLITRIAPSFQERVKSLALGFETEFESKTTEEAEITRVIEKRAGEIDLLERQIAELGAIDKEFANGSIEEDEREEEELAQLEREAQSLLELEQREDLRQMVAKNAQLPPPQSANGAANGNLGFAQKLQAAQADRQRLVKTIVGALGSAGLGERQEGYKRLIHGAIGVREDEIEGMLDEVLATLEDEAKERAVGGEA
ncbi:apses-domain-containing protein [Venturia nashicola]|uniref:Apses-domain-containing protein n=1 Tax=Venturia nashicola TaxID=86259 RepID=A0A4Z1NU05_9PEZI|nr:apses-domain-containing protein [Venturia nashicola]